jgi:DNA-binding FrmR family transcriptional regulator
MSGTDRELNEALELICEARGALNETAELDLPANVEECLDDAQIELTKAKESVKHFSEVGPDA